MLQPYHLFLNLSYTWVLVALPVSASFGPEQPPPQTSSCKDPKYQELRRLAATEQ
jgi:hypothetical protein